jgi:predicted nicotinamide N-methyase
VSTSFVTAHTRLTDVAYLPGIRLHQAAEAFPLWERTRGHAPPFWAFAWAGGLGLARYLSDRPDLVRGRTVLDVASGSGLVAIVAARAGAAAVTACDVDPLAATAVRLNAAANGVDVTVRLGDVLDGDGLGADVILAGDVCYERALAGRVTAFLERARARGADVLLGDPDRAYLPRQRFTPVATYPVPVTGDLEDAPVKQVTVWSLPTPDIAGEAGA